MPVTLTSSSLVSHYQSIVGSVNMNGVCMCSTADSMIPFGIWLARSSAQAERPVDEKFKSFLPTFKSPK